MSTSLPPVALHFAGPFGGPGVQGPSSAAPLAVPQQLFNSAVAPRAGPSGQSRVEPSGSVCHVLHICAMPEYAIYSTEEIRWAHKSGQAISSKLDFKATIDPESAGSAQCLLIQNICTMPGLSDMCPEELRWHDKLANNSASSSEPLYRPTSTLLTDEPAAVSMTPEIAVAATTPVPFGSPAPLGNISTPATDTTPAMPVRNLFPSPQASTPNPPASAGSPLNPALSRAPSTAGGDATDDPTPSDRVYSFEEARWWDHCCTTGSQLMAQSSSDSPGRDGRSSLHSDITAMAKYAHLSVEELRWQERMLSPVPDWFRRVATGRAAELIAAAAEDEDDNVPPDLRCPITLCIMSDPVIASDGHTYERSAIADWLLRKRSSPKTNLPLADARLLPNLSVKSMIEEWKEKRKQQQKTHSGALA